MIAIDSSVRKRRRECLASVWVLFVLLAAAANVPFAVSQLRSRTAPRPMPLARGPTTRRAWPAATPHDKPWPMPTAWDESRAFGFREVNVFSRHPGSKSGRFQMLVQLTGWPLAVLEQKHMWWDWSDPTLKGPEPDPAIRVRWDGLILNPLLVGSAAFTAVAGPYLLSGGIRRYRRRRRGRCEHCGYDLTGNVSGRCPECGTPIASPQDSLEKNAQVNRSGSNSSSTR